MLLIHRLIIFSRYHLGDELLEIYLTRMNKLKVLVGMKSGGMKAHNEDGKE